MPEMSAEAAAYPKLHKIYKELIRQNETIFMAEKERNALEEKQSNLKGLSKLTKKGEQQNELHSEKTEGEVIAPKFTPML